MSSMHYDFYLYFMNLCFKENGFFILVIFQIINIYVVIILNHTLIINYFILILYFMSLILIFFAHYLISIIINFNYPFLIM